MSPASFGACQLWRPPALVLLVLALVLFCSEFGVGVDVGVGVGVVWFRAWLRYCSAIAMVSMCNLDCCIMFFCFCCIIVAVSRSRGRHTDKRQRGVFGGPQG